MVPTEQSQPSGRDSDEPVVYAPLRRPSMPPEPGLLIDAYQILEPIGRGGMGEVYRARDTRLGRQVAIKFVSEGFEGHSEAAARLDREARLASSLNHPGIVSVFDVGSWQGRPYVVMELIEGVTLAAALASGRLPVRRAAEYALQIADALSAAHDAGVVHRDLKPQNIMVGPEGRLKIVDFGLSRSVPKALAADAQTVVAEFWTADHAVLGTAGYMAPEQVRGETADGRADQFALGAILYEMLAGQRAFHGDTDIQTLSAILTAAPAPVAGLRPEVPPILSTVVERCLAKAPDHRYASARDLVHDLREAVEQQVLETRGVPHRRRQAASRMRWPVFAGIMTIAVAVAGGIWGLRPSGTVGPDAVALRQIVVLPFVNITKDPADQVFADGLAETLTSSLTQLERFQRTLRVVPASEVRRGLIASVREARQAFGATFVVSGSIQRLPSLMRLTLNLVDARALVQIGSRTIDFAAGHEALTQDTVVGAVIALLAIQLEPGAQAALTAGGTTAASAYQFFVQARGYLQPLDPGAENIDRAIELLGRAVAVDPRYALAHSALAEAYWRKYEASRDVALIDQAVASCERALAIDNRLPPIYVTLATIARGRGRYEEAVAVAQRAVELDPVGSDGYRELGLAYEAMNRLADAEATYRQAILARPDDWLGYNTLGLFFLARARLPEAERAFQQVIALTPDNTRGYNNLGATYFNMGRLDEAAGMWERSTALRPTPSATSNLGSYYYSQGRFADAARAFQRAVELSPNDHRLWRNLGAALHWAPGQRGRAAAAYEKAVALAQAERRINPRQAQLFAELADSYSMLGKRAEALDAAAAAERLNPVEAGVSYNVATAYEQVGERALALQWLAKAMTQGYSREAIDRSPGLEALRKDDRFVRLTR